MLCYKKHTKTHSFPYVDKSRLNCFKLLFLNEENSNNDQVDSRTAKWPDLDIHAMNTRQHYYQGSAICKRGHSFSTRLEPGKPEFVPDRCITCGQETLVKCPNCSFRIRGNKTGKGYFDFDDAPNPGFCDICGEIFPWATRTERIYELENRLDQESIDPEDRAAIAIELGKLLNLELTEEEQKSIWLRISEKAGQSLRSPRIADLVASIASKVILKAMGME